MSTTEQIITRDGLEEPSDILASRLIDAWCDSHGGQISWVKAVEITAIVTKQSDEVRARMLALNEDNDPLGIVQRLRNGGQPDLANMAERMQVALQELVEKADLSDDSQYGTLSTKYVRDVCARGLAAANGSTSWTNEDANNYCRILTALGMEEEGDPVAEVKRLQAECDRLRAALMDAAHELERRWAFGDADLARKALEPQK